MQKWWIISRQTSRIYKSMLNNAHKSTEHLSLYFVLSKACEIKNQNTMIYYSKSCSWALLPLAQRKRVFNYRDKFCRATGCLPLLIDDLLRAFSFITSIEMPFAISETLRVALARIRNTMKLFPNNKNQVVCEWKLLKSKNDLKQRRKEP